MHSSDFLVLSNNFPTFQNSEVIVIFWRALSFFASGPFFVGGKWFCLTSSLLMTYRISVFCWSGLLYSKVWLYCEFVRFRLLVVENQDYFCSEKMLMSWEICWRSACTSEEPTGCGFHNAVSTASRRPALENRVRRRRHLNEETFIVRGDGD